jgi:DNA-binding CsgD family transcriptional regulator
MAARLGDSKAALRAFGELIAAGADTDAFATAGVRALTTYVGADLATLSDCDLVGGHRRVLGARPATLGQTAIATFDRHFRAHPLVAFHARHRDGGAHRISDSWSRATFERTPLYDEYYRPIGIRHAVAVPLYVDGTRLVSFVLNRADRDFGDDEIAALDFVRGPLSALYRRLIEVDADRVVATRRARSANAPVTTAEPAALTMRESEIMRWVIAGKSDAQIAAIVGASARTVQKHLQHVYVKLGVESRTAAAMRVLQRRDTDSG